MGKSTKLMTEEERLARNAYMRNYYHTTPYKGKAQASRKAWYAANKERHRASCKAWDERNPGKRQAMTRKSARRKYPEPTRPSPENCEICGKPDKGRVLALDHCHATNKFRGWLCKNCNLAIGRLGDSSSGVHAALEYLLRFENEQ